MTVAAACLPPIRVLPGQHPTAIPPASETKMTRSSSSRRDFLKTSAAATAGLVVPYYLAGATRAAAPLPKKDEMTIGCIGTGDRWKGVVREAMPFGKVVGVCDVDRKRVEAANAIVGGKAEMYGDYRRLLDRKDIDVITIVTPDHWHTKIAIEAMQAGKDVYCEKPLTLTIDEGKLIRKAHNETKRVFQVGTQQRSEMDLLFLKAVALVKHGRVGKLQKVQCAIGAPPLGGPFPVMPVPENLNWDMWLGQAPKVPYTEKRCHYEFRWWYEYSGGKMTDWGAHHVDIATWAMGMDHSGPTSIEGIAAHPNVPNGYNVAMAFNITCKYPNGVELVIRHDTDNGITFEGDKSRFFVSRSALSGPAVRELKENPLPENALVELYKGKQPGNHMRNFFECIASREEPISDVETHHRAMTTCHLANIAIRLGRKLNWNPETEEIVGDDDARTWQARQQRKGYEIVM